MPRTEPKAKPTETDTEVAQAELVPMPADGEAETAAPGEAAQAELAPMPADGEAGTVAPVPVNEAALERYLSGAETITAQDPEEVVRGIVARILEADSLDAVLNRTAVVGLKTLMAQPIQIDDVRWGESTFEEGLPFYAIVDCVNLATGEKVVASCGGQQVMAQLFVMKRRGWLPAKCMVDTTPKPTTGGFFPIFLSPLPPHLAQSADPERQF